MKLSPEEFFRKYRLSAMATQAFYGVPASITLAQAALESGWGGSGLTEKANNFFGIKAYGWSGPVYSAYTGEVVNGQDVTQYAQFRAYTSPYQSFKDHAKFLKENSRYAGLFTLNKADYQGWANGLQSAGYATSPTYANKLIGLIDQYDLNKYDKQAKNAKLLTIGALTILFIYLIVAI